MPHSEPAALARFADVVLIVEQLEGLRLHCATAAISTSFDNGSHLPAGVHVSGALQQHRHCKKRERKASKKQGAQRTVV